jgi:hypothetical protein
VVDEMSGAVSGNPPADRGILSWMRDAVGRELLCFVLNCGVESLDEVIFGDMTITENQADVILEMSRVLRSLPVEIGDDAAKQAARAWLMIQDDAGKSVAGNMREYVGGSLEVPPGSDDMERLLIGLACDVYPALLIPVDGLGLPPEIPLAGRINSEVTMVLHRHPDLQKFIEASLRDKTLAKVFSKNHPHIGHSAVIYRNTGTSSGVQLSMIPDSIFRVAWSRARDQRNIFDSFVAGAIKELKIARGALAGESQNIVARVAFAGVATAPR